MIYKLTEKEDRRIVRSRLPVRNGMVMMATSGYRDYKDILLFGTDGSTRGRSVRGPRISRHRSHVFGFQEFEMGPEGMWLYGVFGGEKTRHAVYRLSLRGEGPLGKPYIGEENDPKYAAQNDERHLNTPMGLACDTRGRLYVSDYGNDRIQVFETGGHEGKLLKSIPCKHPRGLSVHHRTGEIYVQLTPPR
jgi:hypothetical protein